jgi:acetyl esterase/lipase
VVFIHGGFWKPFDRRMFQPLTGLHGCVGTALAGAGVATAVISYRQRPEAASLQDALDDAAGAVRFVVDNIGREGGDPARVYVVGHSLRRFRALAQMSRRPSFRAKIIWV